MNQGMLPLSQPGDYFTGKQRLSLVDASRAGREVSISIFYPVVKPEGYKGTIVRDAPPDTSSAPYPVILTATKIADVFAPHLVTHGFVVISVDLNVEGNTWDLWLIDFPLDLLFALDQVATAPPETLAGVMDTDTAGVMGYSFDSYDTLALAGARADIPSYLAQCEQALADNPLSSEFWLNYFCAMSADIDRFVEHAPPEIKESNDGLWQPITDPRIKAAIPMAPEGAWFFGERGLAAVQVPVMVIAGTQDDINDYRIEAVYIYEHLGSPNKVMISFVGQNHMMIFEAGASAQMAHFIAAFFGHHLQGRADYAEYYSPDYLAQFDNLAWGPVE